MRRWSTFSVALGVGKLRQRQSCRQNGFFLYNLLFALCNPWFKLNAQLKMKTTSFPIFIYSANEAPKVSNVNSGDSV